MMKLLCTIMMLNALMLRVMFWNVENLFDTVDNPQTTDEEFTPEGARRWTTKRYRLKLRHLEQTIVAVGGWQPGQNDTPAFDRMDGQHASMFHPADVVGLAEVENSEVLNDLLQKTPLNRLGYRPLLTQTDDNRGIRVAMLYRPEHFDLLGAEDWVVQMPRGKRPTRHMLHVWGVAQGDTLDLVVCHLPSRYGGVAASIPSRHAAHLCLNAKIDSLQGVRRQLALLVMGDMNDYPRTKLLQQDLNLQRPPIKKGVLKEKQLDDTLRYNLMLSLQAQKKPAKVTGSHKYQGAWGYLDQFFATGTLLRNVQAWGVFATPEMLADDVTHSGVRPKRTYYGYNYEGGYSDHLPIVTDLY